MTVFRNREKVWSAMSDGEKERYVKTTTDKGNKTRFLILSLENGLCRVF